MQLGHIGIEGVVDAEIFDQIREVDEGQPLSVVLYNLLRHGRRDLRESVVLLWRV